jgi:hypothetical protein
MKTLFTLLITIGSLAQAGTITGAVQTSSSGAVANAQFTFVLTQPGVVSGTALVVTSPSYCWNDTTGNVRGLPGDAAIPAGTLSQNLGAGTLQANTYYERHTFSNATGEGQPGPERVIVLGGTGTMIVTIAPTVVPATATAVNIYISTTSGSYSTGKQGTISITNGVLAGNFQQSTPLAVGAAIPSNNSSACSLRFNDELQPSYTGYNVNLANVSGAQIGGFPQKWYLSGGASGTINLSNGTPLYSGIVVYPQAIVVTPGGGGSQSISGPLITTAINNRFYVDGSRYTKDATGINTAISDAVNNGSREVWLPCGNINIAATISIVNGGVKLVGCGAGLNDQSTLPTTQLTWTGAAGSDLLSIKGTGANRLDRVKIQDMILDGGGGIARYTARVEKSDSGTEFNGVRFRNGATSSFYAVDSAGIKFYNVWFTQCSSFCGIWDWGTGGFRWYGGGVDILVANSNPAILVQGAVNSWTADGLELDASQTGAFAGFVKVAGFDVNSSFAGAPTGGAGAPAMVRVRDSSFFQHAGAGGPSQGADILVTGTAANPSSKFIGEGLFFSGASISQAAVKLDFTDQATLRDIISNGHTGSTLIMTANPTHTSEEFVSVGTDAASCTGATCGNQADKELRSTGFIQYSAALGTTPKAFASLPTCAAGFAGAMDSVIDSTTNAWGATITGGGANKVLGFCDGTNWTVAGK